MMDDKQLNIYQPLLSVRRFPLTAPSEKDVNKNDDLSLPKIPPLPSYRSELKSGPIRNAGTVPFVWEKSPGMPKYKSKPRTRTVESPDIAPKLPPGRILEMRKQTAEHLSGSKHRKEIPYGLDSVSAPDASKAKVESSKNTKDVENSDTRERDEYLDAINKLSRTESFFLNCSLSGISELDNSGVDAYQNFSTDLQTRDFMMDRFLPAAKAMTLETPQYAPRKQPVVQEQPGQTAKVVSGDNKRPLRYGPNVVPHYTREKEEEESVEDYDVHGQLPVKACGLLPQLCFKSFFFLLNPLPGMRDRTQVPVPTSSRTHGSSSSAGSCGENEKEHIKATVYEQGPVGDSWTNEHEDKGTVKNQSDQMKLRFDQQNLELSTTSRKLQSSAMSSYDYDLPRFAFSEDRKAFSSPGEAKTTGVTDVNSCGKRYRTFKELLADPKSDEEVYNRSPVTEKTLHVDLVHMVKSSSMYSRGADMKGLPNSKAVVVKDLDKFMTTETTRLADSSVKDAEDFIVEGKEENLKVMAQKNVDDFSVPSLADKSNMELATKFVKDSIQCKYFAKDLTTATKFKVLNKVISDSKSQQSLKVEDSEKSEGSYLPIPPPLPKSPSDSWLSRALPSMGSKTPSLQAHFGTGVHPLSHTSKTSFVDHKWETIVKTTKGQQRHERLTSIPEA